MTNSSFDELNQLSSQKERSKPYEEYFGEMNLTTEQRIERIDFAEDFEDAMMYVLSLALTMYESGEGDIDKEYLEQLLISRYTTIALIFLSTGQLYSIGGELLEYDESQQFNGNTPVQLDEYLINHINEFSEEVIAATFDNSTDDYFFSNDRAKFIAEDEANTFLNYKDYQKAILSGKKYKTWVDIGDSRERKTHLAVGGKTIPIKKDFTVGGYPMRYPKDTSRAPGREYINCRCSIRYS